MIIGPAPESTTAITSPLLDLDMPGVGRIRHVAIYIYGDWHPARVDRTTRAAVHVTYWRTPDPAGGRAARLPLYRVRRPATAADANHWAAAYDRSRGHETSRPYYNTPETT